MVVLHARYSEACRASSLFLVMLMRPTLIIFDFDGTLGDTRNNIVVTLQRTMQQRGLELRDEAACAATIGLTLEDSFMSMYPAMSREEARDCVSLYRDIFYQSIDELTPDLFVGVRETLAALHAMDIKMSIASSRSSPSLLLFLKRMGIAQYFSYVLGSDNVTKHKPEPEPVLKTLRELGITPEQALVVGDMPMDIAMARNASVRSVGVSYGNATAAELHAAGADYVISEIGALLDIVG